MQYILCLLGIIYIPVCNFWMLCDLWLLRHTQLYWWYITLLQTLTYCMIMCMLNHFDNNILLELTVIFLIVYLFHANGINVTHYWYQLYVIIILFYCSIIKTNCVMSGSFQNVHLSVEELLYRVIVFINQMWKIK